MTDTRRRVKLYALNAERQWDDRGTGHVSSNYIDRVKGVSLLVKAESDGTILLESKIQPDTAYQKQQDTLIVWSEAENFDLALSFQEKSGCDEIWEKICQVQGKDPSVEVTQDVVEESEDERFDEIHDTSSISPIELPFCDIAHLEEMKELTSSCLTSNVKKEKLSESLERDSNYIKKLIDVFHSCEENKNLPGLHLLFDIFRNIFLLNKNQIFEMLFSDDIIMDVIGCLEYDPLCLVPKRHRNFLKRQSKYKEVACMGKELSNKIHQTYRVQYIQDMVLPTPSVFEENMLSALSSFIFFNKIEIVTLIQDDEKFLPDLIGKLTNNSIPDSKRRDLVLFMKECCNYSQALQPPGKQSFYKMLSSLGIMRALENTLHSKDKDTKLASVDILTYVVEYTPSAVREYILQQHQKQNADISIPDKASAADEGKITSSVSLERKQGLLNVAIDEMINDTDPELSFALQLVANIRLLIDPENMITSLNKSEKTEFLSFFYKHSIHALIEPLMSNTASHKFLKNDDYRTANLQAIILELLTFCVEHHSYHIKNIVLNKDLLRRVLVLVKSKHKNLVLGALRFMRKLIGLKDEFYYRYITKGLLFTPVVDTLIRNNGRYNLVDSAIWEMLEFIKSEDIKSLYVHIVETHEETLKSIDCVSTFKNLRMKYSQHLDRMKDKQKISTLDGVSSIVRGNRFRRDQRQPDEHEELWFSNDDADEVDEAVTEPSEDHFNYHHLHPYDKSLSKESSLLSTSNAAAALAVALANTGKNGGKEDVISTNNGLLQMKNAISCNNPLPSLYASDDGKSSMVSLSEESAVKNSSIGAVKKALVDYETDSSDEDEDEVPLSFREEVGHNVVVKKEGMTNRDANNSNDSENIKNVTTPSSVQLMEILSEDDTTNNLLSSVSAKKARYS